MGEETVTTGVDDLLEYLKGKDRIAMQDAAVVLKVPLTTMQAWVDFLVEEKILGIEYKFTKPFIYLNKDETIKKKQIVEKTTITLEQVKQEYMDRAAAAQIPQNKMRELWRAHVQQALAAKREYFFDQAGRRNAGNPRKLWEDYQADLLSRC
jgi:hypothetical protein